MDVVDGVDSGEDSNATEGQAVTEAAVAAPTPTAAPSAKTETGASRPGDEPFGEAKRPPYEFSDQQKAALTRLGDEVETLDPEFSLKSYLHQCRVSGISQGLVYARLERVRDELREEIAAATKTPA
jgi:hypothetical protein